MITDALHVNDHLPNTRTSLGVLYVRYCYACNKHVSSVGNPRECPHCQWSEMEALDFTAEQQDEFEHQNSLR